AIASGLAMSAMSHLSTVGEFRQNRTSSKKHVRFCIALFLQGDPVDMLYSLNMTKLLEAAIDKARELPARDQDTVALAILSLAGEDPPLIPREKETGEAFGEGKEQARRGEFVDDEDMADFFKRHCV